ncbi:MAG: hypothetical protein AB1656_24920 [Candidatus Omnitrophota bacterium]
MKRILAIVLMAMAAASFGFGQEEPPLEKVFQNLGLDLKPEDEIVVKGPAQGLFLKKDRLVEYMLIAKYSFGIQDATSIVRAGFYSQTTNILLRLLFECGPQAGDKTSLSGLPASPKGSCYFDPGKSPFGFYVQSANFNPSFSLEGETVCTQNSLNKKIRRFGDDIRKAHIYPYKTSSGIHPDWYVICWEFSTNNDNQDIITAIRGVELLTPIYGKKEKEPKTSEKPTVAMK